MADQPHLPRRRRQGHELLARPPYFRNGAAPDLQTVVTFYNVHFNIGMTSQQQTDMVNFLAAQ